jgi:hypothetical protein
MKRMVKALAAVVMVIGATAAVGCNRASDEGAEAVAPVESPATAPVVEETAKDGAKDEAATKAASTKAPGIEQNSLRFGVSARIGGPRYYAPHAPPAARVEYRGVAPSHRHFWAPGYWRWSGRQYTWIGGRWELHRPHHVYMAPRWVAAGPRYQYVPGHWVRRY